MRHSLPFALALVMLLNGCVPAATTGSGAGTTTGGRTAGGDPSPAGMEISTDSTYGYSQQNPIKVGGAAQSRGPINERAYLDGLRGPAGQRLRYRRLGSCCTFATPNSPFGGGALDIYEIQYDGLEKPIQLYINMYDYKRPKIPVGFTAPTEPTGGGGRLG